MGDGATEGAKAMPILHDGATIDEVREFFRGDRFAYEALSPVIEEARRGYAKVRLDIAPSHRNVYGNLMGGATFTLCDYAFSIAACIGQPPTVTTNCSIDYLGVPKTDTVVAEAVIEKAGRSLAFGIVRVRDSAGNPVARVNATGFRKG